MTAATAPKPDTDLGPSVTAEFTSAQPLDNLLKGARKKSPDALPFSGSQTVTPPRVEAPPLDPKIFRATIAQLDKVLSAMAEIPSEPDELLMPIADGLYPLAAYYSSKEPTITTLWIVATISMVSYSTLKLTKYRARKVVQDGKASKQKEASSEGKR